MTNKTDAGDLTQLTPITENIEQGSDSAGEFDRIRQNNKLIQAIDKAKSPYAYAIKKASGKH